MTALLVTGEYPCNRLVWVLPSPICWLKAATVSQILISPLTAFLGDYTRSVARQSARTHTTTGLPVVQYVSGRFGPDFWSLLAADRIRQRQWVPKELKYREPPYGLSSGENEHPSSSLRLRQECC
jgi:hypothetical protein